MKFNAKHAGRWVVSKNNRVIATDKTLTSLMKKIKNNKNEGLRYALIPKNYVAG